MSEWPIEYVGARRLQELMRPREAVAAITEAVQQGLAPGVNPPRTVLEVPSGAGHLLAMPAASSRAVGAKVATGAPDNPARGLPRVQGVYLLFEPSTLRPVAAIDGAALTTLRTPAVSIAAVLPLLSTRERGMRVVVYGAGPQGTGHVNTLRDIGCELTDVTYVVRDPSRVDVSAVDGATVVTADARDHRPTADIVICATTSRTPVLDSRHLAPDAVVLAVGSHEPDAREVDAELVGRSQVVVEDETSALLECGDVVMAIEDGFLDPARLVPMADVVRGHVVLDDRRPVLFKGSGMAWQDLAVAEAAVRPLLN